MKIYLMRHAQTDDNLIKRYTGGSDKVGINKEGKKQIERIIPLLQKKKIKVIYSSPFRRCLETASFIKKYLNVELMIEERLKEVNYGRWQGLTSTEVKKLFPEIYKARGENPALIAPPGGETLQEMQNRVIQLINEVNSSRENVLFVTHGSCIHVALIYYQGIDLNRFWIFSQTNKLEDCSLSQIPFPNNLK